MFRKGVCGYQIFKVLKQELKGRDVQVSELLVVPPEKTSFFGLLDVCSSLSGPLPSEDSLPHALHSTGFPPITSYTFTLARNFFLPRTLPSFLGTVLVCALRGAQQSFQEGRVTLDA